MVCRGVEHGDWNEAGLGGWVARMVEAAGEAGATRTISQGEGN